MATSIKSGRESEPEPKPSSSSSRALLWSSRGRRRRRCMRGRVADSAERWWLSKRARVQQSVKGHLTVGGEEKVGAGEVTLFGEARRIEQRKQTGPMM